MARFNLSFFAVFLVLAAFAMSMPTKRDQSQGLGLDTALSDLQGAAKFMEGLNNKDTNDQNNQAQNDQAPKQDTTTADKKVEEEQPVADTTAATPTEKGLYSGNFKTPTATPTSHPTSQPNALGKIPVLGGLLGGTGGLL
ncbi:uncharacterized protein N7496_008413 [Penicillium cataractarum]|uniref:Uncharacterized protein n=1 Tax=Penicillium cataractarum TaxID=2100454 RepID=A0A9W9S305_9EURO|nr:uncharacterized protein N7496_008413 [Penicillium cataractarum]KAJ5368653.1 hypothetical protein N7496_008413 [Penicillium cataractarum]